jgi:hypothetical protein
MQKVSNGSFLHKNKKAGLCVTLHTRPFSFTSSRNGACNSATLLPHALASRARARGGNAPLPTEGVAAVKPQNHS